MPVEKAKLPDGREVNTSERFEQGRTFPNKFWNAARFALMNLEGYEPAPGRPRRPADRGPLDPEPAGADDRRDDRRPRGVPVRRGDRGGSATSPGTTSATGTSSSSRGGSATRDPPGRPARAGGGARRPLPAAPPDRAVRDRAGLAGARPGRPAPRPARTRDRRGERLHRPLAGYPDGLGRRRGRDRSSGPWQEKIKAIRNLRAERNVPKEAKIAPIIDRRRAGRVDRLRQGEPFIRSLTPAATLTIAAGGRPPGRVRRGRPAGRRDHPAAGGPDRQGGRGGPAPEDPGRPRQAARRRSQAKLSNESFVSRAPAEVVAQQRAKEAELLAQRAAVVAVLGRRLRRIAGVR